MALTNQIPAPKEPQKADCPSASCCGSLVMRMLPVIDNVATGEEIRKRREAAKISLRKVAEAMGWSAAYQSDLELGRRSWTETKCLEVECVIARFSRHNAKDQERTASPASDCSD